MNPRGSSLVYYEKQPYPGERQSCLYPLTSSDCFTMCQRKVIPARGVSTVLMVVVCILQPRAASVQAPITDVKFASVNLTSVSPFVPHRLMSPGWSQVPSALSCATRAVSKFPQAGGFLYSPSNQLCTPVLWLEGAGAENASGVASHEGSLYLKSVCPDEFQLLEYGSAGELACLQDWTTAMDYQEATDFCNTAGSSLAAVRSAGKLDLIREVSGGNDRWIGLDDIAEETTFVWQIDGSNMTEEEKEAIFPSNEPNDMRGDEDCVQFRRHTQKMNDKSCGVRHGFICEIAIPGFT